ncbi:hypothetical protein PVAG01_00473 [Phlyctema vagabunda]|uniref:Uncharacterized protein n=1 Tax=Phlyctema vagabunda TaxID=108571 RepID=A0ABR4PUC1_9HELO
MAHGQTTTSFFLGYFDIDILSYLTATVIESDASATTYRLTCGGPEALTSPCGSPFTFTEGPSTFAFHSAEHDPAEDTDFTINAECLLEGTTQAICTESFGGTEANFPGLTTETYSSDMWQTVGLVDATAAAASASITASSSVAPGSTPTSTLPVQTTSTSSSEATRTSANTSSHPVTSSSSSSSSSSSTSAAAMARITAGPGWAVGAGALAALMAL